MLATEAESLYDNLQDMSVHDILTSINQEDRKVPDALHQAIPAIESLVNAALVKMQEGGRLFYMGAGTSGRIGVLDASECPPTFGVAPDLVTAIMAGGDSAIRSAAEGAEDDPHQGWIDLQNHNITDKDFVIGIAASGRTPYVVEALKTCRQHQIMTGCVVCNANSPIAAQSDYPVEVVAGPEFITGSTRMKAGTAQKLALNMISTSLMIRLGRVQGNRMVHMQLTNEKLVKRGTDMVVQQTGLDAAQAESLLKQYGSVKLAVDAFHNNQK
jgi:N-acetylmuramic acid 6-phosphate etherase